MSPNEKRRAKQKLRLLYSALDYLGGARPESATVLYAQLLVGTLIRSLLPVLKLPKSIKRAKALGIAVHETFVPEREKPLQRKTLKRKFQWRNDGRDNSYA